MSVFIVPSTQSFTPFTGGGHRHVSRFSHGGNRCGAAMQFDSPSPFDIFLNGNGNDHYHARQSPFFSQFAEEQEDQQAEDQDEQLVHYIQSHIRHQQQRQAAHLAAVRRQAEVERERERRRIQHQHEQQRHRRAAAAAAHAAAIAQAAWQEEQARLHRLAVAEEHKRRKWEAIQRQRAAAVQHAQHQQEQIRRRAALQQQQQQQQWQELASHGLATALQFAEWLGGLNEEDVEEEHHHHHQQQQPKDDEMQVDEQAQKSKSIEIAVDAPDQTEDTVKVATQQQPINDQDAPEEDISKDAKQPTTTTTTTTTASNLIFTHPLPSDINQRTSIKADDIQVTFDEPTKTVQIRGLWDVNKKNDHQEEETIILSSASSVTTSDEESERRGRKRSRSPKRSRVSDVDEVTGEEIVVIDQTENADGFVNVAADKQPQGSARIPLPEGANPANLRAELTDEGFNVFI